ncbi:hypothetical protein ALC56_00575 [Trachymyrmex septentrionalis]|uniref:Uncharacterized protein n=1 Tax=Trachymyrmex septentrionalis TaxID=34720 RepID=A0A195FWV8_9HYME|nr:hypothetical protein ALC56_00575 [Trachymyrmex septentrionalis]
MIDINIFRITEVEAYKSRQNLNYGITGFLNSTKRFFFSEDTRNPIEHRISDSKKSSPWISDRISDIRCYIPSGYPIFDNFTSRRVHTLFYHCLKFTGCYKPLLNPIIIYYGAQSRNTNLRWWITTQRSAYLFLQNDMLALPIFHHTEGL